MTDPYLRHGGREAEASAAYYLSKAKVLIGSKRINPQESKDANTVSFTFAVPQSPKFFYGQQGAGCICSGSLEAAWEEALQALERCGGRRVEIDYEGMGFKAVANLLYFGPWVAERLACVRSLSE